MHTPTLSQSAPAFPARQIPIAATALMATLFGLSLWLLQRVLAFGPMGMTGTWFSGPEFSIEAAIGVDALAAVMLSMVLGIATLVFVYSIAYMRGEANRFWLFLTMFVAAMCLLLVAKSTLVLFAAWELVGFCSYLLIGFWRDENKPARASQKAFIINRVGDALFLSGLLLQAAGRQEEWVYALLFLGVCAKSAQLPLHGWLPDAMAGPTPVSSLIHAATMVAAGVYVFARLSPLMPPSVMLLAATVGSLSAAYGAFMALIQTDLKRMLAFSTMSQLGLMMLGIASGDTGAGLMHLFAHAFFKCALFLLAGLLIHLAHTQELYKIRAFRHHASPRTVSLLMLLFAVAGTSLAGVPLTTGFLTKDAIVAASLEYGTQVSLFFPFAALLTTFLTGTYLSRAFRWVFVAPVEEVEKHAEMNIPLLQWIPVALLILGSGWWMLSVSPLDATDGWLGHIAGAKHQHTHDLAMLLSLLAATAGLLAGWFGWQVRAAVRLRLWQQRFSPNWAKWLPMLAAPENDLREEGIKLGHVGLAFSRLASWFDRALIDGVIRLITNVFAHSHSQFPSVAKAAASFDSGVIDGLVNGFARGFGVLGTATRSLQGGKVQTYLVFAGLALLSALVWMVFREAL